MTWDAVRKLYPDLFVKFEITESHVDGNLEYVDDITVIKAIEDGKEAMREFVHRKEGQYVYSTKNDKLVINLIKHVGVRKGV